MERSVELGLQSRSGQGRYQRGSRNICISPSKRGHQEERSGVLGIAAHREQVALQSDIFIPQRRILPDELLHQPDAFLALKHLDGDAPSTEKFLLAHECPVFANDHTGYSIEENRT